MTAHMIGEFGFVHWAGPGPAVPKRQVRTHVRPGVDGVQQQRLGKWGLQVEVELTSHFAEYQQALAAYTQYAALVGGDAQSVTYNRVDVTSLYGSKYLVDGVTLIEARQMIALAGPGYFFSPGTALVTRWLLTPLEA